MNSLFYSKASVLLLLFLSTSLLSAGTVTITPPVQISPQSVGTALQWSIGATDIPGVVEYSWSVTTPDGITSVISDYNSSTTFTYMPLQDGVFTVTVRAKDGYTLFPQATASQSYTASSLVTGISPVVTRTTNPFVVLYSAPCGSGSLRVFFGPVGVTTKTATPARACIPGHSVNVLVAGLITNTPYTFQHQISIGFSLQNGPILNFTTAGLPPFDFRNRAVTGVTTGVEQTLLLSLIGIVGGFTPVAYNMVGDPIWYLPQPANSYNYLLRPVKGGTFFLQTDNSNLFLREVDLLGNMVHQATVARIAEQLALQGIEFPLITSLNHDAIRMPNGYTAIIAGVEQYYPNGTDGNSGPIDLLGNAIIVLDQNWQVAWTWNPFTKLDVTRMAVSPTYFCPIPGCEPVRLATFASDWMHANGLWLTDEGNLLLSMRSQDWIIKINYRNGLGNGDVLWRFGNGGDFTITNPQVDPYPWFSGQHFPTFQGNYLTLFDNGNMRVNPSMANTANSNLCCSRVQAWTLNEAGKTATLTTNGSFPSYSSAVGSTNRLASGNLQALSGYQLGGSYPWSAQAIEFTVAGAPVYTFSIDNTVYRAFRMRDLYTP